MNKFNPTWIILSLALLWTVSTYAADENEADVQSRIIGGINVPASQFPTVGETGGNIVDLKYDQFFCSGTLIAPRFVATAGHCVFLGSDHPIIGDTEGRFRLGGKIYKTKRIYVHSSFEGDASFLAEGHFDVSIWELDTPVIGVTPTPLFRGTPTVGSLLTIAGYGLVGEGAYGINDSSTIPPDGSIEFGTTPLEIVTPTFLKWHFDDLAAPSNEVNTSPGDSGGPAFITVAGVLQLAAVTTGGSNAEASFGDDSFDTRLDPIVAWIDRITSGLPVSDAFSDALPLRGTVASDSVSNVGATKEAGEPNHAGNTGGSSTWWFWTAPASGKVTVSTAGSDFDTLLAVYQGKGVKTLTLVAENDNDTLVSAGSTTSSLTFNSVAGKTYHIAVDGKNGATGNIKISLNLQGAADLVVLSIDSDPLLPYPGEAVTFTVNLYNQGTADANCNVAFWPHLATEPTLNDVSSYNTGTFIPAGQKSVISFNYTPVGSDPQNATAWVYADNYYRVSLVPESNKNNNTLSYNWSINQTLVSDNFATPIVLPRGDIIVSAGNANATKEPGEPNHAGKAGGKSIWWLWTASASGWTHVTTSGSTFDTLLAIYTGDTVSNLTTLASNDDSDGQLSSSLDFQAVAGKSYHIAVDGVGKTFGRAVLNIQGAVANPLNVKHALLNFNFKAPGKDALSLSGSLMLQPAFVAATTKACTLIIGAYRFDFSLDQAYKSSNKGIKFTLGKNSTATFDLNLKDIKLFSALSELGFRNANVKNGSIDVPVSLLLVEDSYATTLTLRYNAKINVSGLAK